MLVLVLWACKAPPEAPAGFDELCAWLFARHPQDDAALYAEGLDKRRWARTSAQAGQGATRRGVEAPPARRLGVA